MADSDTTQQVTSQTPATKQKNPKRVAAGKAVAERTRIACAAQKKALIEAQSMIANNQVKQAGPPPPVTETPLPVTDTESTKNVLTTTQWLSVISIVVSLAGIYYKREEIKGLLTKKPPLTQPPLTQPPLTPPPLTPPPVPPNSPVTPRRGIRPMD